MSLPLTVPVRSDNDETGGLTSAAMNCSDDWQVTFSICIPIFRFCSLPQAIDYHNSEPEVPW